MREPWLARLQAPPPLSEIAIRLADEGVPLAVIARAVQVPSADLRAQLETAHAQGRLVSLPPHDWHPHDCRPRQALAEDRTRQAAALRVLCAATRTEANVLLDLVQKESICKARYPSPASIDVHVFHLRRKLSPHGIAVVSMHGFGYRLNPKDRERLLVIIEQARAA
jgi:hypothetical protein